MWLNKAELELIEDNKSNKIMSNAIKTDKMKVAIIGGGLSGLYTAYYCQAAGAQVTLFEQGSQVSAADSFAHAGLSAVSMAMPWHHTGVFSALGQVLSGQAGGLQSKTGLDPSLWAWLGKYLMASTRAKQAARGEALLAMAVQNQELTGALHSEAGLYAEQGQGILHLFRNAKDFAKVQNNNPKNLQNQWSTLAKAGIAFNVMDAAQTHAFAPQLNAAQALAGGVWVPHDGFGNTALLAKQLKVYFSTLGVKFELNQHVLAIKTNAAQKIQLSLLDTKSDTKQDTKQDTKDSSTSDAQTATHTFDHVVLATGALSTPLLQQLSIKLPLAAVRGYSLTMPLAHPEEAPAYAVVDASTRFTMTPMGQRIRVAGFAQLAPLPKQNKTSIQSNQHASISKTSLNALADTLLDWYPFAGKRGEATAWQGYRHLSPDGLPILGASPVAGVWLNLAQGATAGLLGCAAAHQLAQSIVHGESTHSRLTAPMAAAFSAQRYLG